MNEFIVSLVVGILANLVCGIARRVVESVRARKNPPTDRDEG